ncbi:MAG: mechanosensitive ion channel family protein [Bosea sp. (in: a-proteobacteria)]
MATEPPLNVVITGDEKPETIEKLVKSLGTAGRPLTVRVEAKAEPKSDAAPLAAEEESYGLVEAFIAGLRYEWGGMPNIPPMLSDVLASWNKLSNASTPLEGVLLTLLVVGLSMVLVWLAARATNGFFNRNIRDIDGDQANEGFLWRLRESALRLLCDLAALAVLFIVPPLLMKLLLPDMDMARRTAQVLISVLKAVGLYMAFARFMLSPDRPETRLVPLRRAGWHYRALIGYSIFGQSISATLALFGSIATDKAALGAWFLTLAVLITLYKLVWFWNGRHDFAQLVRQGATDPDKPSAMRGFLAWAAGPLLVLSSIVIWVGGRIAAASPTGLDWGSAAGTTQNLLVIVPALAAGVSTLLAALRARREEKHGLSPLLRAISVVMQQLLAAVIWLVALAVCARLWGRFLLGSGVEDATLVLRSTVSVAVIAMAGWALWLFLRTLFDAYRPEPSSAAAGDMDDQGQPVQSRLATVLPVLRGFVLGAVIGLTLLLCLARMGVDIGPLLAGFGILGLAVSFGSQQLVRDIVSGIFFMAEDAFRVGEYIDTGRLKGTVEKISVRSVQLRHQSGQVHIVPYGQLSSVTNSSRDWATVKFNIRLDRSADIEQARKVIKKVGLAYLEDEEHGKDFLQPLKMQGVAEIADSAIVVRLKFTCMPAHTSLLQRESLKRVYKALTEAGVPFASNSVMVTGTPARRSKAAAASKSLEAALLPDAAKAGA